MPENIKNKNALIDQYIVLFMLLSFGGWAVETLFCSLLAGSWCDRGFITLPFCTIYGFTILGLYGLLGTPQDRGVLLGHVRVKPVRFLLYFLITASVTTLAELVTGWFFTKVCGVSLWDYSGYRYHYKGYICLEFFLVWGTLFLIGMRYVFEPLKRAVAALPRRVLFWGALLCCVVLCTDWIVSYARIILIGD